MHEHKSEPDVEFIHHVETEADVVESHGWIVQSKGGDDDIHPESSSRGDSGEKPTHASITPIQQSEATVEATESETHIRRRSRPLKWVSKKISRTSSSHDERKAEKKKKKKKFKTTYPIGYQLRTIFFNSWAHVLLLLIPVGFVVHYTRRNPVAIFFIDFAAMVPSIMVMSLAVESIILYVGDLLGGLISTAFSNAAQLITSILLLRSHQLGVLRTSLVGAILSNLLLMPGLGFLFGGWNRSEQFFNVAVAQTTCQLLLLAILSLMVPTAGSILTQTKHEGIVKQSRGTAIILLICYGLFMLFQLITHRILYEEPSAKTPKRSRKKSRNANGIPDIVVEPELEPEPEVPELPLPTSLVTLTAFTALLTFSTLFATNSIQGLLLRLEISETFLGIVVLPIISNDPTTIIVAVKDKIDLMIGLTMGRCVQTVLLIIPLIVLLAWMLGIDEMSLSFNGFETLIMVAAVLVVNNIIQDGKSYWFAGALLVASYLIVCVSSFYIP